ncbi:N-acetyltransferase [Microbacterium nanhaiense]|uniref:N-acetyltransferase n=1 Tax=Microbacterium nanhaiense TaxID=1301026 RepID=A0ABQ2N0U4_9MICO|nr:GNAT family N-acetyltransferase [Microbacterium nanhaiense]GGO59597.1 N-acetyltransferase [Microbacterium nanhaiense]
MHIAIESPRTPDVVELLGEHLHDMYATSPAESVHALDLSALEHPSISFFTVREEGQLMGGGALKTHDAALGEVKSMRTAAPARGRGVASLVLTAVIDLARQRGLAELNLETGTEDYFAPARRLYERHGFAERGPFADYTADPNSTYYGMRL